LLAVLGIGFRLAFGITSAFVIRKEEIAIPVVTDEVNAATYLDPIVGDKSLAGYWFYIVFLYPFDEWHRPGIKGAPSRVLSTFARKLAVNDVLDNLMH
jgi:hypothetical protein